jgi:hypothetical protein
MDCGPLILYAPWGISYGIPHFLPRFSRFLHELFTLLGYTGGSLARARLLNKIA